MFNSHIREIEDDPFFSDPIRLHREHMQQMMRGFSEPFGGHLLPSVTDRRGHGQETAAQPSSSLPPRDEHRDVMRHPLSMFDMMTNMRKRVHEMHRNFENSAADSNNHTFRQSSFMSYSKVGNDPPKVIQASTSTRCAPGGIKETRRTLQDSETGVEKMAIGHHIRDRGHILEKKHNSKTGEREFNQDFQNMDESEAQSFDKEWQQELSRFQTPGFIPCMQGNRPCAVDRTAAMTAPEQDHRNKAEPKSIQKGLGSTKK